MFIFLVFTLNWRLNIDILIFSSSFILESGIVKMHGHTYKYLINSKLGKLSLKRRWDFFFFTIDIDISIKTLYFYLAFGWLIVKGKKIKFTITKGIVNHYSVNFQTILSWLIKIVSIDILSLSNTFFFY